MVAYSLLPSEIWSLVIEKVDPRDLLRLEEVSRHFLQLARTKHIWTHALLSICHKYGLFIPSFTVGEMDLSALQRAALGPRRWTTLLEREHLLARGPSDEKHAPVPAESTLDFSRLPIGRQWRWGSLRGFLVPGGRYLVTVAKPRSGSSTTRMRLDLNDLGVPGSPILERSKALSLKLLGDETDGEEFGTGSGARGDAVIGLSGDGLSIRVAVLEYQGDPVNENEELGDEDTTTLKVISFTPSSGDEAESQVLASLRVTLTDYDSAEPDCFKFKGIIDDKLLLTSRHGWCIVWDYTEGAARVVKLGIQNALTTHYQYYLLNRGTSILALSLHEGALIFNLPPRQALADRAIKFSSLSPTTAPHTVLPPLWRVPNLDDTMNHNPRSFSYIYAPTSRLPITFDVLDYSAYPRSRRDPDEAGYSSFEDDGSDAAEDQNDPPPESEVKVPCPPATGSTYILDCETHPTSCDLEYVCDVRLRLQRTFRFPEGIAIHHHDSVLPNIPGASDVDHRIGFLAYKSTEEGTRQRAMYYVPRGDDFAAGTACPDTSDAGVAEARIVPFNTFHAQGWPFACTSSGRFLDMSERKVVDYLW